MQARRVWAGAAVLLSLGCADLGSLDAGTCGNGILDPGEDCDTSKAGCGAPKSSAECRFVCESDPDCPANHHCGLDQICRQANGSFEALTSIAGELLTDARLGDFDADGRADLASVNQSGRLEVSYLGAEGVTGTATFQTSSLPLSVGQLTEEDSRSDIVHLPSLQVGVLRGLTGRTLEPTAYSPIPVPEDDARFFVLEGRSPAVADEVGYFGGQEILQFSGNEIQSVVGAEIVLFTVPYSAAEVTPVDREIGSGNLDARIVSPCDEFVLTKFDHDRVSVYTPCKSGGIAWNHDPNALPSVMMPSGKQVGNGVLIAGVDGDPFLDLLIAGKPYPNPDPGKPDLFELFDLYVAFGAGDGTFHDGSGNVGVARVLLHGLPVLPLAAADLTSDGIVDFVLPQGIVKSNDCSILLDCWSFLEVQQAHWSRAVVADFNANGYLDVVAITDNSRYVDFLNGTGQQNGIFNQYRIPTAGAPFQLAKGDFDGDLIPDIAISEIDDSANTGSVEGDLVDPQGQPHDSLSILFGRSQGAPEAPVSMGRLTRIEGIATGQFWFQGGADYMADLGVLSRDYGSLTRSVALFAGATNRQLQSPFILADSASGQSDFAVNTAVGAFTGEQHPDVASLALTLTVDNTSPKARLWMLESTGEAELAESKAKPSPDLVDDLDIDPCTVSALPLDVEGDGVDELALLGRPKNAEEDGGRIVVAHAEGGTWRLGSTVNVTARFVNAFDPRFLCRAIRSGETNPTPDGDFEDRSLFQVTDFDGDGTRELLTLTRTADSAHRLSVFPIGADLGANQREIALPNSVDPLGFRAISADADPEQEFVLVTYGGVFLADVDVQAQSLTNLQLLYGSDIGQVPVQGTKGEPGPQTGLLNYFNWTLAVLDGDFNGDRLTDFAIAHDTGVELFLATAVRP